jgi:signal peptidase II
LSRKSKLALIIFLVLVADQVLKVWVKTHMTYGEEFSILGIPWARLHFVENKGMAFGLSFGGEAGKLALSLFRVFAIGLLIYLINQLAKAKEPFGLLVCFSLILAGAIGNMIDSAFYGLIFEHSSPHSSNLAQFMPADGGYASFLHGKVVDMFYFPLIDTVLPEWLPFWGGTRFEFFKPVFNLADTSISVGVIAILLFYRKFFTKSKEEEKQEVKVGGWETVE